MSRRNKFRIWNTYQKKFYQPDEIATTGDGTFLFWDYHEDSGKSWAHDCYNGQDHGLYVIQQFTGLLANNGCEIYEGDIILGSFFDTEYHCSNVEIQPVVFNNGAFNISSTNWHKPTLKIIGNIYETPELLK